MLISVRLGLLILFCLFDTFNLMNVCVRCSLWRLVKFEDNDDRQRCWTSRQNHHQIISTLINEMNIVFEMNLKIFEIVSGT